MSKQINVISEHEALRATIREAHEVLKDLRALDRKIVEEIEEAKREFHCQLQGYINKKIQEGLAAYAKEVEGGIKECRKQVAREKKEIERIVLGKVDGLDMKMVAKAMHAVELIDQIKDDEIEGLVISKQPPQNSKLPWIKL